MIFLSVPSRPCRGHRRPRDHRDAGADPVEAASIRHPVEASAGPRRRYHLLVQYSTPGVRFLNRLSPPQSGRRRCRSRPPRPGPRIPGPPT
jgi:hypothetical protein